MRTTMHGDVRVAKKESIQVTFTDAQERDRIQEFCKTHGYTMSWFMRMAANQLILDTLRAEEEMKRGH